MCAKIYESKTKILTKSGRKEYNKCTIIIPKHIMKICGWKSGDNIKFDFSKEDLINDQVVLKKVK